MNIGKPISDAVREAKELQAELEHDWAAFKAKEKSFLAFIRVQPAHVILRLDDYIAKAERFSVSHPFLDVLYKVGAGLVIGIIVGVEL